MVHKSKPLSISVIVVNFNSSPFIKDCIDSLLRYTDPSHDEIIVIDNNSTDTSPAIIEHYKKVKLVKLKKNIGYGAGCNAGARIAKGDILLCMNPDVQLLTPLNSIRNIFMNNNTCAIVAPVVVSKNKLYSPIWNLPTVFGEFLGDFKIFSRRYHLIDPAKNNTTIRLRTNQFASGAALFINKTYFDQIDGFDENFFLYFEEIDLFLRLYKYNLSCFMNVNSKISHLTGGSSLNLKGQQVKYHYASKYYYFHKHFHGAKPILHKILTITALASKLIVRLLQHSFMRNQKEKINVYVYCIKIYLFRAVPHNKIPI